MAKVGGGIAAVEERLLTQCELAEFLGVSTKYLEKQRCRGGGIPFVKLGDGPKALVRYRTSSVHEYLARHDRANTSDAGTGRFADPPDVKNARRRDGQASR